MQLYWTVICFNGPNNISISHTGIILQFKKTKSLKTNNVCIIVSIISTLTIFCNFELFNTFRVTYNTFLKKKNGLVSGFSISYIYYQSQKKHQNTLAKLKLKRRKWNDNAMPKKIKKTLQKKATGKLKTKDWTNVRFKFWRWSSQE